MGCKHGVVYFLPAAVICTSDRTRAVRIQIMLSCPTYQRPKAIKLAASVSAHRPPPYITHTHPALCPVSEMHGHLCGAAKYAFEARSLTDVTHAVGHISFLSEVASVMVQLLKCHPISRPAKGAPGKASRSCKWEDNGWDLFPCGVLDAATPWPTLSDAQWAEIETISCR